MKCNNGCPPDNYVQCHHQGKDFVSMTGPYSNTYMVTFRIGDGGTQYAPDSNGLEEARERFKYYQERMEHERSV